jgi:hypothetical protein
MYCYFFSGSQYIRVQRNETGPGMVDDGYPTPISSGWDWPSGFGENGIDAALYSGSVCYFFKGTQYIQVTRGITGPGNTAETLGPNPISDWNWPDGFGESGIDAALWSGSVTYFFQGHQYIRVTRESDTDKGHTDQGYPTPILSGWEWEAPFDNSIKAALPSGSKAYFFSGTSYIRVSRGFELPGFMDEGYPADISNWQFPSGFGTNGIDAALYSGGPLETPGASGLSSNFNYILADGGNNLTSLSVTINIDSDLVSSANGFGFQLNGYADVPTGSNEPPAQQYVIYAHPDSNSLEALVKTWYWTGNPPKFTQLFESQQSIAILPANDKLQAGSVLNMALVNNNSGNITGCKYEYTDPTGATSSAQINISGVGVAPITAFMLNIVAYGNTTMANFTSAEGTITYSASNPLTALGTEPTFANIYYTEETANVVYEQLPPAVNVSQLWGLAPPGWVQPDTSKIPGDKFIPPRNPGYNPSPPHSNPLSPSHSNPLSSGAIAGIAIGAVIGLVILGLIFFFLHRRKLEVAVEVDGREEHELPDRRGPFNDIELPDSAVKNSKPSELENRNISPRRELESPGKSTRELESTGSSPRYALGRRLSPVSTSPIERYELPAGDIHETGLGFVSRTRS